MSRFVNGVIIGIVAFLVVLSVFWYVMEASGERQVEQAEVESRWAGTQDNGTLIETRVTFANPHNFSVDMTRYEYEFLVNGQRWDWGGQPMEQQVAAGGESVVLFTTRFDHERVTEWLRGHVDQDETTEADIRGKAEFLVGNRNIDVDFDSSDEWDTGLLDGLNEASKNCKDDSVAPCVEEAEHAWQVQSNAVVLKSRLAIHNPTDDTIRLRNLTGQMLFNDVAVADGESYTTAVLEPGATGNVEVFYYFDHDALVEWIPTHIQNCESSDVRVSLGSTYSIEVPDEPTPSTSSTTSRILPPPPTTPTTTTTPTTPSSTPTTPSSTPTTPSSTPTTPSSTPTASSSTPTTPLPTSTTPSSAPTTPSSTPTTPSSTPPTASTPMTTTQPPQGTTTEPPVSSPESETPQATTTAPSVPSSASEPSEPETSPPDPGGPFLVGSSAPPSALSPILPRMLLPWELAAAGPAWLLHAAQGFPAADDEPAADSLDAPNETAPEENDAEKPLNWTFQPGALETRFVCAHDGEEGARARFDV